ncbi:MAG: dockerin type I domain-containing protein [candidate division Zixibacteria bacterium]|nr:dockerin type I domain-containing protein [candidate division Zixibacteria bacterium]
MSRMAKVVLVLGAVLLYPLLIFSAPIHVPDDYSSIQPALDAAIPGDTVLVSFGVFSGPGNQDLNFNGKSVILKSQYGAASTIISCGGSYSQSHRGFVFANGEGPLTVVDGFTITGGMAGLDLTYPEGGGIWCNASSPTIKNCYVRQNSAFFGGGIYCRAGSAPHILSSVFDHNVADSYGGGAGCRGSGPHFINCTFSDNSAINVFEPKGGGISCSDTSLVDIDYCIIAFSSRGGAIRVIDDESLARLKCSDIFGNDGGDWVGVIAGQYGIDGNFSGDPQFNDRALSNYFIYPASPCAPTNNSCSTLIGGLEPQPYLCGDPTGDGAVNIRDIVFMINAIYKGGPQPNPPEVVDVNNSGVFNILDITYLINYVYKQGAPPNCP